MMYLRLTWATLMLAAFAAAQPPPATDPKDLATLSGQVVSLAGQPLKKTTLTLRGTGQTYTATSDAEGKFLLEGVSPGRYSLMAERQGYLRQTYGAKRASGLGTQLSVNPGETLKDLKLSLTPQAAISGKVLDDEGDPVAQVMVRASRFMFINGKRQIMPGGGGTTDENGDFKLGGLAPGRYFVIASPQRAMFSLDNSTLAAPKPGKIEEDLVSTYHPSAADFASATPVDITAGNNVSGADVRLRKTQVVRVKGKVVGQPAARLRVMLMQPGSAMMSPFSQSSALVGKDGSFELTHVLPGSYTVAAIIMEGMSQMLGQQQIEVGAQNLEGVVLALHSPFELRGSVQTVGEPANAAPPGAKPPTMRIFLNGADGVQFNSPQATVNEDGTFTLPNVSPGKYRLNIFGTPAGTYVKAIRYGSLDALEQGLDLNDGAGGALQVVLSNAAGQISGSVQTDQQPADSATVTLIPDPPSPDRPGLYQQTDVDQNGKFTFHNLTPGKYRVYAWEDLEPGIQQDPEFMKPLESLGANVAVGENGKEQVTVTRISAATVDEARLKSGR